MTINQKLLTPNQWSRPGRNKEMQPIKAVVIHWLAAPRQKILDTWQYFENRKKGKTDFGGAHFGIDIDGSTYQFIPNEEMAYHVGSPKPFTPWALEHLSTYPNNCTLGIELAHLNWEGQFSETTWESCKILTVLLLKTYGLTPEGGITTHNKVVGWKECPKWFVTFPDEFERFVGECRTIYDAKIFGTVKPTLGAGVYEKPNGKKMNSLKKDRKVELAGFINGYYFVPHIGWVDATTISL